MKNLLAYMFLIGFFISCNTKPAEKLASISKENFTIHGKCTGKKNQTVYLFILKDTVLFLVDSATINKDKFYITNKISRPYKALIQLKNHSLGFPFILTNESIEIELNENNINESTIKNSPINDEFANIRKQSTAIFQKIDYLFPQLQKARMENDFKTLDDINIKINDIETENNAFIVNYIQQNSNKPLSALLLNDLWKAPEKDSIKLQNLSKKLAPEIQKVLDFTIH